MTQMKIQRLGPIQLTNAAANILQPGTTNAGVNDGTSAKFILIKQLWIVNDTNASHTFKLFIGATAGSAAGTEFCGSTTTVAANSLFQVPFNGPVRLDTADFLTGLADANTALTIHGQYEIGIAG